MIHIYDGMAVLRRRFDADVLNRGPRSVFIEMLTLPRCDVAIWCFEGRGSVNARRKIFPGYKLRPSTMTDGLHALVTLTRDALRHTRAIQIDVPGREADDVIAHLCEIHGPTAKDGITVHTIDKDLLALGTDKVRINLGGGKPLVVKLDDEDRSKDVPIPAHEVRLFKTLVGDNSDKIPGMKGFGGKAYVACDRRQLARAFQLLLVGHHSAADFERAGVKAGMAQRMCEPEQAALLRAFWEIVGFLPMPGSWEDGIVPGKPDQAAGDAVLKQFHH